MYAIRSYYARARRASRLGLPEEGDAAQELAGLADHGEGGDVQEARLLVAAADAQAAVDGTRAVEGGGDGDLGVLERPAVQVGRLELNGQALGGEQVFLFEGPAEERLRGFVVVSYNFV